jgi:hypothetical protein
VRDREFLDATGFARHRHIGDLARYTITDQGLDTLAHFGDVQPSAKATPFSSEMGTRYSDEQLYALAMYIYSLHPPPKGFNIAQEMMRSGDGSNVSAGTDPTLALTTRRGGQFRAMNSA